jgi:Tol biopolymer transport system component
MNLDVSPDGRTIAFDLLGDIYTMPIGGGRATRIAAGMAYETQPRFSPDGRQIAFTSDRGGGENIWLMGVDGSNKKQLTKETFRLLNNPTWSPDGRFVAARKHFTTQRSAGTGEIWMYHVAGGEGVALVERPNPQFQKELGEPMFTPDGTGLYFSRDVTPGNIFQYAQNSNDALFAIERYDLKTGERSTVAGGPGGAVRPQPSPDGRYLAYVKRERAKSKLYVKDLRSGEERKIYDALDQDMQETWAVHGVYPNMDWTPDSRSLVFWAGGKIHRIAPDGSGHAEIPFQVADSRDVIDPPRPQVNVFSGDLHDQDAALRCAVARRPRVVFESLGPALRQGRVRQRRPALLTRRMPISSSSRPGRATAAGSCSSAGTTSGWASCGRSTRTARACARSGQTPGHYRRPRFSPDGQTIVYENRRAGDLTSEAWSGEPGDVPGRGDGGTPVRLVRDGGNPQFGATGDRVYIEQSADQKLKLISVDTNGKDPRTHAQGDLVVEYQVAPTGDHIAFRENYNVFVVPFFQGAKTLEVGAKANALPLTKATGIGGQYLHWSGNNVAWSMGPTLYSAASNALIRADGGKYAAPTNGIPISVTARADVPQGVTALVGAKVVTMADEAGGIIDDGVVLIEGNRIRAVGRRGQLAIPTGARQVDVAGKFIIPA